MRAFLVAVLAALTVATAAVARPPRKITIDMQNAEIGNVLRLLADVSGENLVYGDEVKGKITLKLKDVPWERALDVICKTRGLGYEREGNIVRIAPQATLDAELRARLDLVEEQALKGPLTTRIVPLSYARAKEMAEQVKLMLSPRGSVAFDERTNTLIIRDVRGSPALRP